MAFKDFPNREKATEMIAKVLQLMLQEYLEIPFISYYRKDQWEIDEAFQEGDPRPKNSYLWQIYDWDEKWYRFSQERERLKALFDSVNDVFYLKCLSHSITGRQHHRHRVCAQPRRFGRFCRLFPTPLCFFYIFSR